MRPISNARYALDLMNGPVRDGVSLGHGHLFFAGTVSSPAFPRRPRTINGADVDTPSPDHRLLPGLSLEGSVVSSILRASPRPPNRIDVGASSRDRGLPQGLALHDSVVSLTPVGEPRMPNGIEVQVPIPAPGELVRIGAGRLCIGDLEVTAGPIWDARPLVRYRPVTGSLRSRSRLPGPVTNGSGHTPAGHDLPTDYAVSPTSLLGRPLLSLVGHGPGLTPFGDDILVGYLASRSLFLGRPLPRLASRLGGHTTALSATLLELAAFGRLPEAAHRLLAEGDPGPLLSWGATSGSGLLVGLGLGRPSTTCPILRSLAVELPAPFACSVVVAISEIASSGVDIMSVLSPATGVSPTV